MNIVKAQFPKEETQYGFSEREVQQIKNLICKGIKDDEFPMFLRICERTGLDPFAKQIYAIPRGGSMTIQVSIDGSRLIAERTKRYSPGREPVYTRDEQGQLISATSFVKKQTPDGTWHEIAATAYLSEYNANSPFWKKMPHVMLAKCAEAAALRKAFPAELSGFYVKEEMDQADAEPVTLEMDVQKNEYTNMCTEEEITALIEACSAHTDLLALLTNRSPDGDIKKFPKESYFQAINFVKQAANKRKNNG